MIIYLHGFNSSPASFKARQMQARMQEMGLGERFTAPALPPDIPAAIQCIEAEIACCRDLEPTLVGSSLGGYYATFLAEKYRLRAALINPAVRPYELLTPLLGRQKNLYTGAEYELTPDHIAQLKALEVARIADPTRYLLLVETGDEVLDYRQAVEKYAGARQVIIPGGDHSFTNFGRYMNLIFQFAGLAPPAAGGHP